MNSNPQSNSSNPENRAKMTPTLTHKLRPRKGDLLSSLAFQNLVQNQPISTISYPFRTVAVNSSQIPSMTGLRGINPSLPNQARVNDIRNSASAALKPSTRAYWWTTPPPFYHLADNLRFNHPALHSKTSNFIDRGDAKGWTEFSMNY
jgi:hypothetical protein